MISVGVLVHDAYVNLLLSKCLPSILDQTYKDIEIIVACDNLSKDNIKAIKNKFPDIKVINTEKSLMGYVANNKFIELAQGEWLAHIDADDFWTTDHLEILFDKTKEGYNVVYGVQIWKGTAVGSNKFGPSCNGHSSTMWRKADFPNIRYRAVGYLNDADLWKQMLETGKVNHCFVNKIITYEAK